MSSCNTSGFNSVELFVSSPPWNSFIVCFGHVRSSFLIKLFFLMNVKPLLHMCFMTALIGSGGIFGESVVKRERWDSALFFNEKSGASLDNGLLKDSWGEHDGSTGLSSTCRH